MGHDSPALSTVRSAFSALLTNSFKPVTTSHSASGGTLLISVPEGGRPRVLRRNDRLGSQGVLSGFSWVLSGFSWVLMGSQGVLSGYSDCAFLGSQVVLRQAPPL